MASVTSNSREGGYTLTSEMARACLPLSVERNQWRRMAWVNSICVMFLVIGVVGARPTPPPPKPPPPPEEAVPAIIEPPPPPPAPPTEIQPKDVEEESDAPAPRVVAVTLDSPAVRFAVPTIGNLLVPAALAVAPPIEPMRTAAALPKRAPERVESTGIGGDRPEPPYPKMALDLGQSGSVVLLLSVNDAGAVTSVEVKSSSGHPILDHGAEGFVKEHWRIPPGEGGRVFEATITYRLE